MKATSRALLALAAGLGLSQPAFAETDFLTQGKIVCTPERVTRCGADQKCTTREASARDKTEVLVIDFAGKSASVRKEGALKPFADVVDVKVEGEERRFAFAEPGKSGSGEKLEAILSKSGRLTLLTGKNGSKAEAICVAES